MPTLPIHASKAFHMTDNAKKNWRENPPNPPWSSPPAVHNETGATSRNSHSKYSGRKVKRKGAKSHIAKANASSSLHDSGKENFDSAGRYEQKSDRSQAAATSRTPGSGFNTNDSRKISTAPELIPSCQGYHPGLVTPVSVDSTSIQDMRNPQIQCQQAHQKAPGAFVGRVDSSTMTPPTTVGLGIAGTPNGWHHQNHTNNSDEENSPITSSVNSDSTSPATSPERDRDDRKQHHQSFDPDATPKMANASMPLEDSSMVIETIERYDPLLWPNVIPFEGTTIFSMPPQWPVIKILNVCARVSTNTSSFLAPLLANERRLANH